MRATLNRQTPLQQAPAPLALLQQALTPWTLPQLAPAQQAPVPQAPQMVPPIHQPPPFSRGQPATPYQQAVQLSSKTTGLGVTFDSLLTNLPPLAVRTWRAMGDKVLKVEMMTASLPVAPGEHKRGPSLGRPVSRCLTRLVRHLAMFPQLQYGKVPHPNMAVVRGPHLGTL